jgi:hypothetical protein
MNAVAFDTLKFVEKLEAGGFTTQQAKAAAQAFADATGEQLATKYDLKETERVLEADLKETERLLKADINETERVLKADISHLKADIGVLKADLKETERVLRTELKGVDVLLRTEIRDVKTQLEAKIEASSANPKVEILRWLVVTQVALAGFIFAAIKSVK